MSKKKFLAHSRISNTRGSMTIEMIFGMITAIGVGVVLFVIAFSLTTVEIAQYIAYSAARAQASANLDGPSQILRGKEKYMELRGTFFSATASDWFEFSGRDDAQTLNWSSPNWATKFVADNRLNTGGTSVPWAPNKGFGFQLKLKLLGIKLPVLGTAGDKDNFNLFMSALILRHPSHEDCINFFAQNRVIALTKMDPRFTVAPLGSDVVTAYVSTIDMMKGNACGTVL